MQIVWDPNKADANLKKHGVDFADAVIALEDPNALTIMDASEGEYRFKTLARGASPDVLFIVHTEQDENSIRIISVRLATNSERKQYFEGDYHE